MPGSIWAQRVVAFAAAFLAVIALLLLGYIIYSLNMKVYHGTFVQNVTLPLGEGVLFGYLC